MDYLDGMLSDQEIRMLEDFLLINPDLRAELEGTERIVLIPENVAFSQKEFLKKSDLSLPVNESNFEDFCVANAEGDLHDQKLAGLISYIHQHPGSEKTLELYKQLHLKPEINIAFEGKEKLKKSVLFIPGEILIPLLSVAAAVAFIIVFYVRNQENINRNSGLTADLPEMTTTKPVSSFQKPVIENNAIQENKKTINQATLIAISTPKEKKQPTRVKALEPLKKTEDQNKKKDLLPPQRLNPSVEIKLPSMADNSLYTPVINGGKISYANVKEVKSSNEFLSLSEYARQQFSEKLLGNKDRSLANLTVWQLAGAGVTGINKLTGGKMKLEKRTGEDGNVTAYSFDSRLLSFSTTAVK
jgi:hypothetical protein